MDRNVVQEAHRGCPGAEAPVFKPPLSNTFYASSGFIASIGIGSEPISLRRWSRPCAPSLPCDKGRAFSLAYQIVLNFSQNLGTIYKQDDALSTFCYNVEAFGDTFAASFGDTIWKDYVCYMMATKSYNYTLSPV